MGALGRLGAFVGGALLGAGIGAVVATLTAPQSGDDLKSGVVNRIDRVRVAGVEAQSRTEEEMIRRFRADTNDAAALRDSETQSKVEAAQALASIAKARAATVSGLSS